RQRRFAHRRGGRELERTDGRRARDTGDAAAGGSGRSDRMPGSSGTFLSKLGFRGGNDVRLSRLAVELRHGTGLCLPQARAQAAAMALPAAPLAAEITGAHAELGSLD